MDYREFVEQRLKDYPKRLKHTYGVYKRSLELGKLYNADLEVLKVASLMHDVTKHESDEFHEKLINDSFILLKYPKAMWHAFSAAKVLKDIGITNKKIIEAVKYHVFGKIEMNIETMIICVSDFTEENRDFLEAKEAYKIALKSLTDAYLYSIKSTMDHLKSKNIEPIKEQIDTYLYYKERRDKVNGST